MRKDYDGVTVWGNNHPKLLLNWYQLTPTEQKEFNYLETEDEQASASFFRYRGWVYDLSQFETCHPSFANAGFDGQLSDSMCSGVLVKLGATDEERGWGDYDHVRVYTFCS